MLLAVPGTLLAQQKDSTAMESIIGLKMQSRYVPVNQPFNRSRNFMANTYVTVIGSGYRQFSENYGNGPYLTVGFGKWFSPYWSARIAAGTGYLLDNYYGGVHVKLVDFRASALYNVSAYIDGYNPDRLIEFYPMAGVGLGLTWLNSGKVYAGVSGHLGYQVNLHAMPGVDLVIEHSLELVQDSRRDNRMDVWRGYLFGLHTGFGARFSLDRKTVGADPGYDWFVTAAGGVQTQNSQFVSMMDFKSSLGPCGYIGVGRYYNRFLAFRLSAGYSSHVWKREVDTSFNSRYIFARPEAMFDLLQLIPGMSEDSRFGVVALLGHEVGNVLKMEPSDQQYFPRGGAWYVGFSGAVQLKVRFFRGMTLFVEPRFSYVPYTAPYVLEGMQYKNYYDAVFSMSMGLEARLGGKYWRKKEK